MYDLKSEWTCVVEVYLSIALYQIVDFIIIAMDVSVWVVLVDRKMWLDTL